MTVDATASEAANAKPLFLLIEQGPAAGQAFQIVQGRCLIGRASATDLCLRHSSVSRHHAELKRSGNQLFLKDLGSQNGTYVNQQRIAREAEVFAGDSLLIGSSLLKLQDTLSTEFLHRPSHRRPLHYTALVASISASFSTLVSMLLLKLLFQAPAPLDEVEITPVQPSEAFALELPELEVPPVDLFFPQHPLPQDTDASPPFDATPIFEAFQQARAQDALWLAQEAEQTLLAEQLSAFVSRWKAAEKLWKEVSKAKAPNVRLALAAQEAALLAAERIVADSDYARELNTRIAALKRMALAKPASPSKTSTRTPPPSASSSKRAPASSRELQEKRRAIDEAFGF